MVNMLSQVVAAVTLALVLQCSAKRKDVAKHVNMKVEHEKGTGDGETSNEDAKTNGVCAWKMPDAAEPTVQVEKAQCDNANSQLTLTSVTMITQTFKFQGQDTCQIIIGNFLQSKCEGANGKATDVKQTSTDASCTITTTSDSGSTLVEHASTNCDANERTYVNKQTIEAPRVQPYNQEKECSIEVRRWREGMEKAHAGSCAQESTGDIEEKVAKRLRDLGVIVDGGNAPDKDAQDPKNQQPSQAPSEEDGDAGDSTDGSNDDSTKDSGEGGSGGSKDDKEDDSAKPQATTQKPEKSNAIASSASFVCVLLGAGALTVVPLA